MWCLLLSPFLSSGSSLGMVLAANAFIRCLIQDLASVNVLHASSEYLAMKLPKVQLTNAWLSTDDKREHNKTRLTIRIAASAHALTPSKLH
jgi:hypothetical protein